MIRAPRQLSRALFGTVDTRRLRKLHNSFHSHNPQCLPSRTQSLRGKTCSSLGGNPSYTCQARTASESHCSHCNRFLADTAQVCPFPRDKNAPHDMAAPFYARIESARPQSDTTYWLQPRRSIQPRTCLSESSIPVLRNTCPANTTYTGFRLSSPRCRHRC